jgi:multidrug efflux pump subunit AcrB
LLAVPALELGRRHVADGRVEPSLVVEHLDVSAAVGVILDDGIVMVEYAIRRLRASGSGHGGVVLEAGREMMGLLTGSSLATVVVFVPLAFLQGVTGAFFKALALTMVSALTISYLFASLGVPVLAQWILREKDASDECLEPTRGTFPFGGHPSTPAPHKRWRVLSMRRPQG